MQNFRHWLKAKGGDMHETLRDRLLNEEREQLNFVVDQYAAEFAQQLAQQKEAAKLPVTPYDGMR